MKSYSPFIIPLNVFERKGRRRHRQIPKSPAYKKMVTSGDSTTEAHIPTGMRRPNMCADIGAVENCAAVLSASDERTDGMMRGLSHFLTVAEKSMIPASDE